MHLVASTGVADFLAEQDQSLVQQKKASGCWGCRIRCILDALNVVKRAQGSGLKDVREPQVVRISDSERFKCLVGGRSRVLQFGRV